MSQLVFFLVIALGRLRGVCVLGQPGVGKTPWAISIALALGRFHVRKSGLRRRASFRRGNQFDVFRQKPGEVQEGILLDDPVLPSIGAEEIKA